MKRYLISSIVVLTVLAVAWAAFGQQQGDRAQRFAQMREAQAKAVKLIETQLEALKKSMAQPPAFDRSRFQEMSEEERTKYREERDKAREAQQTAINTIIAQIAVLQGQMQPLAEGERYILVSSADLKAVETLAKKEKATQTAEQITTLLEPPRRGRGSRGQGRPAGAGAGQRQRQGQ